MTKVALIRLRAGGPMTTYRVDESIHPNDYVIIEADRGIDYGEVVETSEMDATTLPENESSLKNIIRKVSAEDLKQIKANIQEAKDAMRTCSRKMKEAKLEMKLVDAECSFDKKKIIFYFTAEGRIDFRELVKELAKIFKRRIEMRQIGVRDEARIFGGIGPCGQSLCCMKFLKNFEAVSMKMAKLQRLSLSAGKISGICGRLMCCLSFEHKAYRELSKGLPKEGQIVETAQGKGEIISVNVLKRLVYVELEDGRIEKVTYEESPDAED